MEKKKSLSQSFDTVSGIEDDDDSSTETPLVTSTTATETTKPSTLLRTLKLEDYDEITFEPALEEVDDDNSSEDEDLNALSRVRRKSENDDDGDGIETTTVLETSTTLTSQEPATSSIISTMLQLPQPDPPQQFNNNEFSYPPSSNPHAQYIYFTTRKPPLLKNYYDFYPSQPDFFYHRNYNFIPLCTTANTAAIQQYPHKSSSSSTFIPIVHDDALLSSLLSRHIHSNKI